jgi:cysteine desulfurase
MLSKRLIDGINARVSHVERNGPEDPADSYPGCVNLSFAFVEGESLLMALKEIALSSGSACTSASLEPSYVLRALGKDEALSHSSIRFGLGRFSTEADVDFTIERVRLRDNASILTTIQVVEHVQRLREMSPLWEMVQDGIDLKSIQWTQH